MALVPVAAGAAVQLSTDTPVATAGYYQLHWTADSPRVTIEVRTPESAAATVIYSGPDRATVVSGQTDGVRTYRAGEIGADGKVSTWSEPVTVTVAHHPLSRALAFFAIGAVVFCATLLLIAQGVRGLR